MQVDAVNTLNWSILAILIMTLILVLSTLKLDEFRETGIYTEIVLKRSKEI